MPKYEAPKQPEVPKVVAPQVKPVEVVRPEIPAYKPPQIEKYQAPTLPTYQAPYTPEVPTYKAPEIPSYKAPEMQQPITSVTNMKEIEKYNAIQPQVPELPTYQHPEIQQYKAPEMFDAPKMGSYGKLPNVGQ